VACVAWNRLAPDVLAVGYGPAEANGRERAGTAESRERADGLVAFWSLKNPEHPEWHFATPFGVTALDFSPTQHNLLAVGLHDGTVSVYDARVPGTNAPFLRSGGGVPGKHSDPVWQVSWARGGGDSGDKDASALVSISTDGRVTQWRLEKGLEHVDLMRLTRVARRGLAHSAAKAAAKPPEATISRRGAGTCFDFSRADPTTYVAGTEEGVLHKCSSAYSEQYLRTYHGHSGPVHRAVWSPFARDVFASASADWTTKLWFDAEENAALTLQSGRGVDVTDVAWSPSDATVLATSSLDGGLDVWDLAISTLRPAVSAATAGGSLACVAFSETSPVIVAGGRGGFVGVYRLVGAQDGARDESGRLKAALGGGAA
jgi:WD40 repeat protein